jgi:hypothetical protein
MQHILLHQHASHGPSERVWHIEMLSTAGAAGAAAAPAVAVTAAAIPAAIAAATARPTQTHHWQPQQACQEQQQWQPLLHLVCSQLNLW